MLLLRRFHEAGIVPGGPAVTAPPFVSRSSRAPTFTVATGDNSYYALEVATEARLLNGTEAGQERSASNFYASWMAAPPLLDESPFTLPESVWSGLRHAQRLYYRVITSSSPSSWVEPAATTADATSHAAPFMRLADARDAATDATDLILILSELPSGDRVRDGNGETTVRYDDLPSVTYERVTILPDGPTITIEDVR